MEPFAGRPAVLLVFALTLATCPMTTNAAADSNFPAELDSQWNYDKPDVSEQRFRAEVANWPAGDPRSLEVATQIARAQGLQRKFADAHATLDSVEKDLDGMPAHVRVRYLLERGRAFNSSGAPERAMPLFAEALSLADCAGDSFYAIDAAHMLGIAAPAGDRLDWNMKALAMAEHAGDARSKRWLGPLYNNIGYTYQERGDFAQALVYYRKALPAYEARGEPGPVRIAQWMIARAQRLLGELDSAEKAQRTLLAEFDRLGEQDGYVYEELAEIALARGDAAAAKPWAAKAWTVLSTDEGLRESDPGRLARLAALGGVGAAKQARQ
jgi:tetratricopeptide (TPR) repeat protein